MAEPSREASGPSREPAVGRLARAASRRRWPILAATALAFVAALPAALTIIDATRPYEFRDPESESSRASERYEAVTGTAPTPEIAVLASSATAASRARATLVGIEEIAVVRSQSVAPHSATSRDSALLLGYLMPGVPDQAEVGQEVLAELGGEPQALVGGPAVASHEINEQTTEDIRRVELIALPILFLLCLWAFRGILAALLPLAVGAISIVLALAALRLIAAGLAIDVFSVNVLVGLGLGLAIDYSLFVLSRYREELGHGRGCDRALEVAMAAAGRTVAFSAAVVTLALLTLLVFPQRFLYSVALAGALVAAISAVVAVVVLPALLSLLGERVGRSSAEADASASSSRWSRLARWSMRRPASVGALATALLVLAALPALGLDLTAADARALPDDRNARRLEDRLASLPQGSTEPIVITDAGSRAEAMALAARIDDLRSVDSVSTRASARAFQLEVVHGSSSHSPAAEALLKRIRELAGTAAATGATAALVDAKESLRAHLTLALALLVATTFVLLAALTRSLVLPGVMVLFNLLTIAAAFGIVVFVFQEGALDSLLGLDGEGAIDISIPVLLFAVAFGLSTDYGIFVLARIKEARDGGAADADAVELGLGRCGALVTTAALLFAVAAGGFVTSELVLIRQFALGLVAAVLIDATIVRGLLVPAALALLGQRAWWAPGTLGGRSAA